jgi:Nitrile hydratase, alpha chain
MSEASSREQMERRLLQRSLQDDAFRQRLLEDPKGAVEQELGTRLPEDVRVVAVEETADTIYLVVPFRSAEGQEVGELSDRELEAVAGGWDAQTAGYTCTVQQTRCGVECA